MDQIAMLEFVVGELRTRDRRGSMTADKMETSSNCEPWTVRQLASHAFTINCLWGRHPPTVRRSCQPRTPWAGLPDPGRVLQQFARSRPNGAWPCGARRACSMRATSRPLANSPDRS